MNPILMYFHYALYSGNEPLSFFQYYIGVYFGLSGMPAGFIESIGFPEMNFGHLWFIQHLLVYAIIYWILRKIYKKPFFKQESKPFSGWHLLIIFLVISFSSLIVRIWYPTDYWIGLFGFFQVELAHWPQYLVMFVIGIIAYRKNWLNTLNTKTGYVSLLIGLIMVAVVYIGTLNNFLTLWSNWTIYESLLAVVLIFGLLTLFREKANRTTSFLKALSRSSYAAYIIHMPIVLAIQYALDTVVIGGAAGKFITVSIISVVLTYLFSALLIRIKPLRKIL